MEPPTARRRLSEFRASPPPVLADMGKPDDAPGGSAAPAGRHATLRGGAAGAAPTPGWGPSRRRGLERAAWVAAASADRGSPRGAQASAAASGLGLISG